MPGIVSSVPVDLIEDAVLAGRYAVSGGYRQITLHPDGDFVRAERLADTFQRVILKNSIQAV